MKRLFIITIAFLSMASGVFCQDTYEFYRKSPSKVDLTRNGSSVVPHSGGLRIEVVPSEEKTDAMTGYIPMRQDGLQPVIVPQTYIPTPVVGEEEFQPKMKLIPSPLDQPGLNVSPSVDLEEQKELVDKMLKPEPPAQPAPPKALSQSEREELRMWRNLAAQPIELTIQGKLVYFEWANAHSQTTLSDDGKLRLKLSPQNPE